MKKAAIKYIEEQITDFTIYFFGLEVQNNEI